MRSTTSEPNDEATTKRGRLVNAPLPFVMTTRQVRAALGGVSHVTVFNLERAGRISRVSNKAQQSGGGALWDAETVHALARSYKPQANNRRKLGGGDDE